MNPTGYAFLGLTGIVAALIALLAFAVLRFAAAARNARRSLGDTRAETVLLSSALEDAIQRLKAQERATAARAEASERLSSAIVVSLTSGLIVVDSQGTIQILNPAARQILGLAPDDEPSNLRALVPALADVIDESFRTNMPILRRTVSLAQPEGQRHLGVTVSPLAAEGSRGGAVCVFRDLTSVIALEEQLRLKEALARLGELTAGLAHEFRNGLATIHGYARLLDVAQLAPAQQPYLEGIRTETQVLGDVVTKFLDFAKPGALAMAPLDLRSLVQRAIDDLPGAIITIDGEFELDRRRRSASAPGDQQPAAQRRGCLRRGRQAAAARGARPDRSSLADRAGLGHRRRPRDCARSHAAPVPAVLHDATGRDRTRPRDRAESARQP